MREMREMRKGVSSFAEDLLYQTLAFLWDSCTALEWLWLGPANLSMAATCVAVLVGVTIDSWSMPFPCELP
jgi:hypothetical protein